MKPEPAQSTLFDLGRQPASAPKRRRRQTRASRKKQLDLDFAIFHKKYPQVFEELVRLARLTLDRGFTHYSIKTLYELARWHFQMKTGPDEEFKLNNNYHSRYARRIIAQFPEFSGFFELRELKG